MALPGNARGDVKRAVLLALRTWPGKTQTEIANQVGCALSTVNYHKQQFFESEKLPDAPTTVTGKDGKQYPTRKPRQPKPEPEPEPQPEAPAC